VADNLGRVKVVGVEDLLKDLENYDKDIQVLVGHEIKASAQKITRDAKRAAQNDEGGLRRLISYKEVTKTVYELISGAEYSAFVEFGTKHQVRIDHPELSQFAQQFKGAKLGKGKLTFQQAIFEWAKRKGIEKEYWYPIYWSIIRHGIRARPFFFDAYFTEIPLLRKRLENILNKIHS
jgi:hypothetical protein